MQPILILTSDITILMQNISKKYENHNIEFIDIDSTEELINALEDIFLTDKIVYLK